MVFLLQAAAGRRLEAFGRCRSAAMPDAYWRRQRGKPQQAADEKGNRWQTVLDKWLSAGGSGQSCATPGKRQS
jgi:hypothetical protein